MPALTHPFPSRKPSITANSKEQCNLFYPHHLESFLKERTQTQGIQHLLSALRAKENRSGPAFCFTRGLWWRTSCPGAPHGKHSVSRNSCGHAEQPVQEMAFLLVMKMSDQLVSRNRWLNEVHREHWEIQAWRNRRENSPWYKTPKSSLLNKNVLNRHLCYTVNLEWWEI